MTEPITKFTITSMEGERPGADTHPINSEYVEHDWLPYIWPNAFVFARRINWLLTTDGKNAVNVKHWAEMLGMSQSEVLMSANRLIRYGHAEWEPRSSTLLVSRHWGSVPRAISTDQHRPILLDLPDVEVTS